MIRKYLATGTAISCLASLTVTLALAYTTAAKTQVSIAIGLLTVLIGLLVTALIALSERLDDIDRRRIGVASLQRLAEVEHLEEPIVRIVEACADAHAKRTDFIHNRASEAVRHFADDVERMADGSFTCRSQEEELRLVKGALAETKREVRAVASRGLKWWSKPEADVYFKAYATVTDHLPITRIFLVHRDELESCRPVLDRHAKAGISTYALDRDQVPEDRQHGLVLFDSQLLHRHGPAPEGSHLHHVEFTDVADEILEAEEDFEFLLDMATDDDKTPNPILYSRSREGTAAVSEV